MRLGELLIADGRLTEDQLDQALRAQVVWGGRLGTNLVELGLIDLEELSWALARLHRLPVALARHFARTDAGLQARLGAQLAEKWRCVPLARLADDPPRIGLAAAEPLPPEALAEIAAALGEPVETLVLAVAAEMRILYHLELSYGLARPARYLRTRDATPPEPPEPVIGESSEVEIELPAVPPTDALEPASAAAELELSPSSEPEPPTGPELRRYMPMVGEDERRVGRIAIRRVAVYADGAQAPATWPEALRAIRRAHDRDRVGELAVSALVQFCPAVEVSALLVVRGGVAIGWRGRQREGALELGALAVPLDHPSALADAVHTGAPVARALEGAVDDVDHRLAAALGATSPTRLHLCPIALSEGKVACVLYCQVGALESSARAELEAQLASVVASMRSAFLRLIRAASR